MQELGSKAELCVCLLTYCKLEPSSQYSILKGYILLQQESTRVSPLCSMLQGLRWQGLKQANKHRTVILAGWMQAEMFEGIKDS